MVPLPCATAEILPFPKSGQRLLGPEGAVCGRVAG